jgi:hypothetical protein
MRKKVIVAATVVWMLAALAPAAAALASHESSTMLTLPGMVEVEGSSIDLTTTTNRATIRVKTSGLVPGNVYTLWGFSFSNPSNCLVDGCGLDDAADRPGEVGFNVQQIAGHVTGASGNVNLAGSISVENAQGAEYHIVVAEHGALDPENMPEAIKSAGPGVQIGFLGIPG